MNAIQTKHNLDFEVAPWECMGGIDESFTKFRIGTCEGLWRCVDDAYEILAVTNNVPGNGHFDDVLQWFEFACKRDGKALRIMEVWNKALKMHLILKRGFSNHGIDHVIKRKFK